MTLEVQQVINLVEGDDCPDLPVRFTGLDLADYSQITMKIEYENTTRKSKTVTPDGSDEELGMVTWSAGDLVAGIHKAEFELIRSADAKRFTLPRKYPVILNVRRDLG